MLRTLPALFAGMLFFALQCLPTSSIAQNAIIGSGFSTGWTNPSNITYPFSANAGTSRMAVFMTGSTGDKFFRLVRGWTGTGCFDGNNTEYGPPGGSDVTISTFGVIQPTAVSGGTGAWKVVQGTTSEVYIIKTRDACASNDWTIFKLASNIVTIASQSVTAGTVYPGQTIDFDAGFGMPLPAGQGVYLRYSTDNFATSTVVEMSSVTSTLYRTSLTAQAGATYTYYYFTSGSGLTITPANADFYTINLLNNSGSNYTKSVAASYQTTGASTSWTNTAAWNSGTVPIAGQPVTISNNITIPSSRSVGIMTITNGTVTVSAGVTLTVNSGSALLINGGSMSLDVGTVLTMSGNSTLTVAGGSLTAVGTSTINVGTGGINLNSGSCTPGTSTINIASGGSFNRNSGTFTPGSSTVNFQGAGTIAGTNSTTFNNLTINTGEVTLTRTPTVNGTLQINGGNFAVGGSVTYGSNSTLRYNSVTYTPFVEWTAETDGAAGTGRPNNVTIASTSTLNLPTTTRALAGTLTISATSNLNFNSSGDLILRGSWINLNSVDNVNFGSGTGRAVIFTGTSGFSDIQKGSSSNTQSFAYLIANNTNTIRLMSNVRIATTTGDVLQSTSGAGGIIDLFGKTLTLTGDGGNVLISANKTISDTGPGGSLIISGNKSKSGAATLTISNAIPVTVNSGATFTNNAGTIDFASSTSSLTLSGNWNQASGTLSMSGTLIMNSGSYLGLTPTYAGTSTVRYNATAAPGNEWTATADGAVGSGRPANVDIAGGTMTIAFINRAIAGNLTICSTCSLVFGTSTNLFLRGNWTNNNTSSNITHGTSSTVVFTGTIGISTITNASGTQSFRAINLANTNTVQLASNVSITGAAATIVTTSAVGTLDLNGKNFTLSGAGSTVSVGSNYTINGSSGNVVFAANTTISGTATLTLGGSSATTVNTGVTLTTSTGSFVTVASAASFTLTGSITNSATFTVQGNLIRNGGTLTGTTPTYSNTSTLTYQVATAIGLEWSQANYGTAGSGRPQNVVVNETLTVGATRSMAGALTIGASGGLTATNGVTIGMGGNLLDNSSSNTSVNNIALDITCASNFSVSKPNGGEFRPYRLIKRGTGTLTVNCNVRLAGVSGREIGGYDGTMHLNNCTVTLDQTSSFFSSAAFNYTGTNGVININANTGATSASTKFNSGVTVNINAAIFTANSNGVQVNGTAALNVNNGGLLRLNGPYVGNSPTYNDDAGLNYNAVITMGNEWTATTYGPPGVGRPNRVTIGNNVTTTATERACAFEFRVSSFGKLNMGSNPTLKIGGYLTDEVITGNGIPTDATVEFNNATQILLTKSSGPFQLRTISILGAGDVNNSTTQVQLSNGLILANTGKFIAESNLTFTGTGQIQVTGVSGGITSPTGATVTFNGATTIPVTNTNTLTIGGNAVVNIGSGSSLTISDPTSITTTGAVTVNGSLIVNLAGNTYPATMNVNGTVRLAHDAGAAPTANWGTTGILEVTGVVNTAPTNLNQNLANFTWTCPAMADHVGLSTNSPTQVSGIFKVFNTNGNILSIDVDRTYTGRLEVDNGRFAVKGSNDIGPANTLTVRTVRLSHNNGNMTQLLMGAGSKTGSLVTDSLLVNLSAASLHSLVDNDYVIAFGSTGIQTLNFKTFVQTGTTAGFFGSFQPAGSATLVGHSGGSTISLAKANFLQLGNGLHLQGPLTVSTPLEGTFTLVTSSAVTFADGAYLANTGNAMFNSGSSIIHSDLSGITTGNTGLIRTTGTRLYPSTFTVTFNGSSAGVLGSEFTNRSWGLVINNTAGVTLSGNLNLTNLTLNGPLLLGTSQMRISGATAITRNVGGNIVLGGTGTIWLNTSENVTLPNDLFSGTSIGTFAVSSGGTLTLNNQNLTVVGGVNLTSGKVVVPAGQTLTFGTSSVWPTESNANHILGTTIMTARSVGTGAINFMGMALASGADNLGNVTVTRTSGTAGRVVYGDRSGIDCNWVIEADNQPVSGRTLTLSWPSVWDNGRNMNNVMFWRRLTPTDPWLSLGGYQNLSASNPRVATFTTNHFSEWTTSDNNNTLPVTFRTVNAQRQGQTSVVKVAFTTDQERDVKHYTLQRSADSRDWHNISQINARTGSSNEYVLIDANSPATQAWYYRVMNTDLDGTVAYSPVVVVNSADAPGKVVRLYPNPVVNELNLELISSLDGEATIQFIAADGKVASASGYQISRGNSIVRLSEALVSLPKGVYAVKVSLPDGTVQTARITRQ